MSVIVCILRAAPVVAEFVASAGLFRRTKPAAG
jgi:hypothetical protein